MKKAKEILLSIPEKIGLGFISLIGWLWDDSDFNKTAEEAMDRVLASASKSKITAICPLCGK